MCGIPPWKAGSSRTVERRLGFDADVVDDMMGSAGSSATCGYIDGEVTSGVTTGAIEDVGGGEDGEIEESTVFGVVSVCDVFFSLVVEDDINDDEAGNGKFIPPSDSVVGDVTPASRESDNDD